MSMKKQLMYLLVAGTLFGACNNAAEKTSGAEAAQPADSAHQHAPAMTSQEAAASNLSAVALDADKDFVCGMPVKGHTADTAHYKGKVYGFCAKECKDEFVKNPESFLAQK